MIYTLPTLPALTSGNPIVFKCTRQSTDGTTAVLSICRRKSPVATSQYIAPSEGERWITLRKCFDTKGEAYIDIAPVVRAWFKETIDNDYRSVNKWSDGKMLDQMCNLYIGVKYGDDNGSHAWYQPFNQPIINAAVQSWELPKNDGEQLTDVEVPTFYNELPFDWSVLDLSMGGAVRIDKNRQRVLTSNVFFGTNEANEVVTNLGNKILLEEKETFRIIEGCIPSSPFYVRWLNMYGGIDYWCFGNSQKLTLKVTETTTFEPHITYYQDGRQETVAKKAEKTIRCGAVGLTRGEYRALSRLPLSPFIQWYDMQNNRWNSVQCQKSENTLNTSETKGEVELDFTFAPINTQL